MHRAFHKRPAHTHKTIAIDWKCIPSVCVCVFFPSRKPRPHKMNFGAAMLFMSIYTFGQNENINRTVFIRCCRFILPGCCIIQCFHGSINQFIELQLADFNYKIPFHGIEETVHNMDFVHSFSLSGNGVCTFRFFLSWHFSSALFHPFGRFVPLKASCTF